MKEIGNKIQILLIYSFLCLSLFTFIIYLYRSCRFPSPLAPLVSSPSLHSPGEAAAGGGEVSGEGDVTRGWETRVVRTAWTGDRREQSEWRVNRSCLSLASLVPVASLSLRSFSAPSSRCAKRVIRWEGPYTVQTLRDTSEFPSVSYLLSEDFSVLFSLLISGVFPCPTTKPMIHLPFPFGFHSHFTTSPVHLVPSVRFIRSFHPLLHLPFGHDERSEWKTEGKGGNERS